MSSISSLFSNFMDLVNLKFYTKKECDDKYLVKQDFGIIIDNEGILRIVTNNDDSNNVYVGDVYVTKSEMSNYIKKDYVNMKVTFEDGACKNYRLYGEEYVVDLNSVKDVIGKIVWIDNDNVNGTRPDSVVLTCGDESVTVNKDNDWTNYFTLPTYDNSGDEVFYSVRGAGVSGYSVESSVDGDVTVFTYTLDR